MLAEAYHPAPLTLSTREEADFYSSENEVTLEVINQLTAEFDDFTNKLITRRLSPSETGQEIIHELARLRLQIAGDLPLREETLSDGAKNTLGCLYRFEQQTKSILEQRYQQLFRNSDQESTVDNLIDGATAEECALRMISFAYPDSRLYFPNTEDEHNGVDFFAEFPSGKQLAVQVKVVRYPEDEEWRHSLIHVLSKEDQMTGVIDDVIDGIDIPHGYIGRIRSSLEKNIQYSKRLDPTQELDTALMVLSTTHINPRLSEQDVDRLESELGDI